MQGCQRRYKRYLRSAFQMPKIRSFPRMVLGACQDHGLPPGFSTATTIVLDMPDSHLSMCLHHLSYRSLRLWRNRPRLAGKQQRRLRYADSLVPTGSPFSRLVLDNVCLSIILLRPSFLPFTFQASPLRPRLSRPITTRTPRLPPRTAFLQSAARLGAEGRHRARAGRFALPYPT